MIFQSNDDPNVEKDIINSLISLRVAGVAASVGLRTSSTGHNLSYLSERTERQL